RLIADGEIGAEEAVKAYHGVLQQLGVKPTRSLDDDMKITTGIMSYGGSGTAGSVPPAATTATACQTGCACGCNGEKKKSAAPETSATDNGEIDFSKMTSAQKVAYQRARWDRILGPDASAKRR